MRVCNAVPRVKRVGWRIVLCCISRTPCRPTRFPIVRFANFGVDSNFKEAMLSESSPIVIDSRSGWFNSRVERVVKEDEPIERVRKRLASTCHGGFEAIILRDRVWPDCETFFPMRRVSRRGAWIVMDAFGRECSPIDRVWIFSSGSLWGMSKNTRQSEFSEIDKIISFQMDWGERSNRIHLEQGHMHKGSFLNGHRFKGSQVIGIYRSCIDPILTVKYDSMKVLEGVARDSYVFPLSSNEMQYSQRATHR